MDAVLSNQISRQKTFKNSIRVHQKQDDGELVILDYGDTIKSQSSLRQLTMEGIEDEDDQKIGYLVDAPCCRPNSLSDILTKCQSLERIELILAAYNFLIEEDSWNQINVSEVIRKYLSDVEDLIWTSANFE